MFQEKMSTNNARNNHYFQCSYKDNNFKKSIMAWRSKILGMSDQIKVLMCSTNHHRSIIMRFILYPIITSRKYRCFDET